MDDPLDELDKNTHCPENVDEDSWKKLCEVRRKKIQSEEKIQALDNEIYETDQSVCERGALSIQVAKDLEVGQNYPFNDKEKVGFSHRILKKGSINIVK